MYATLLAASLSLTTCTLAEQLEDVKTPSGRFDVNCRVIDIEIDDHLGRPEASMHAYAYTAEPSEQRPIIFFWNGGPGASAALLHAGFASPYTSDLSENGAIEPNPNTLIDLADLVFVDPIGTGLSRTDEPGADSAYWGITEDAEAAAEFVADYLEADGLSDRPVYLCGESYGAVRIAAMLKPLEDADIEVTGLIMISPALEPGLIIPRSKLDAGLARTDRLPALAALATLEEKMTHRATRAHIERAVAFAHGSYLEAMLSDTKPSERAFAPLREQRDELTLGLTMQDTQGRDKHDARFRGRSGFTSGIKIADVGAAANVLLTDFFEIETGGNYKLLSTMANATWRDADGEGGLWSSEVSVPELVADSECPDLFIAGGWYDLMTPFASARRLAVNGAFGEATVHVNDYPAGHVIYADQKAHEALADDLRDWLSAR